MRPITLTLIGPTALSFGDAQIFIVPTFHVGTHIQTLQRHNQYQSKHARSFPRGHKKRAHPTQMGRFFPYAAPSTGAFGEISPQGSDRDAARFRRGRKPLPKILGKNEERRIKAAFGSPADSRHPGVRTSCADSVQICSRQICLWILSFGDAKESIAAAGPRNGLNKASRQRNIISRRRRASAAASPRWKVFQLKHASDYANANRTYGPDQVLGEYPWGHVDFPGSAFEDSNLDHFFFHP